MSDIILGDGGMGSELRLRGLEVPSHVESIWSAWALEHAPEAIENIHFDYIQAGSQYITINNYAVTRPILSRVNRQNELELLTLRALELAQRAVKKSGKKIKIAASLPPLSTSYRADLILPEQELINQYQELVSMLRNKVDIIICETMASGLEARCALQAALTTKQTVWLSWTLHGNRKNTLPSGESIAQAFSVLKESRPHAFLINCCGANLVESGITELKKLTTLPVGGYANAENIVLSSSQHGDINAEQDHWQSSQSLDEQAYSQAVQAWIKKGATIVGGCCRTRPSYIKFLKEQVMFI